MDSFIPSCKIIVSFFPFLCQDANKSRSHCSIIGCNLSKKHKLTLYKTQNGESNYVHHKFFFNFYQELPTYTKPWRHIQILQSWLVGCYLYFLTLRLHDIKKLTSVSLKCTMEVHLADIYILPFWSKTALHLSIIVLVAIYIYFLLYILLNQN